MGVPGRLRWNAETKDGAASTPKTGSPSSTSTAVMGKPGPQPRSITLLPRGNVLAHFRTSFTPIPVDRILLPRCTRNSFATASYPLDRSICRGYQMVQVLLVTSLLVFINGIQFSRENHKFVLRKGAKEMSRFSLAIGESEVMPERVDSMPPSPASRSETPQFRHNTSCL